MSTKSEKKAIDYHDRMGSTKMASLVSKRRGKDADYLSAYFSGRNRLLDVGCGYGRVTLAMQKKGFDADGIDVSPEFIKDAKNTAKKEKLPVVFKVGSVLSLPYDNEVFDGVYAMWGVFNYLLTMQEQVKGLREINRVLKPGGLCLLELIDGERAYFKDLLRASGGNRRVMLSPDGGKTEAYHSFLHDRQTLAQVAKKSGLKGVKVGFKFIHGARQLVLEIKKPKV